MARGGWLTSHDCLSQESLGGNALTTMMAALSPSKTNCTLGKKLDLYKVGPKKSG